MENRHAGRVALLEEVRHTAKLGLPLVLGELGWMSTYIVDALVVGRLPDPALAIAASSLGNTIFYALAFFVVSMLNGLETLVAQAFGRRDIRECAHLLAQSTWIVALGTPLVMGATLAAASALPALGVGAEVAAETSRYVRVLVWSTPPLLAYMALRRWLQSVGRVGFVSASLVGAAPINFVADWLLVFGHLGLPALGVVGSGCATIVVRLFMLGTVLVGFLRACVAVELPFGTAMLAPDGARLRALLRIGWPSAVESFTELGMSTFLGILGARLGATMLAAHQVVLDLSAFAYQASAGLAYATVVRVGQAAGRRDWRQVRRACAASFVIGLPFMVLAASVFAAFAPFWAGLYASSAEVVAAASPVVVLGAIMLVGDTVFVLLASTFTGIGDTRTPLVVSVVWNVALGMPLAYALALPLGAGLCGMWIARAIGSAGAATTLLYRWRALPRRGPPGKRQIAENTRQSDEDGDRRSRSQRPRPGSASSMPPAR